MDLGIWKEASDVSSTIEVTVDSLEVDDDDNEDDEDDDEDSVDRSACPNG